MARRRNSSGDPFLGVGDGLHAFFGGIGFVLTTPSVWPYAAVPVFMLLLLCCGTAVLGSWGSWELSRWIIGEAESAWGDAGTWGLTVLLSLVGILLGGLLGIALAQPLSGFALEKISLRQEEAITGYVRQEVSFFKALLVGLRVALVTVFLGLVTLGTLFVVGLLFPPALVVTVPLKFVVTGSLLTWDFIDYPLGLRGFGLRKRLRWFFGNFGAGLTFGLVWACVLLIPGMALLLLPMGVAGATRLVVAGEEW